MKLKDLAFELNSTIEEVVNHYKHIFKEIPLDENYIFDYETAKQAKPNLTLEIFKMYEEQDKIQLKDDGVYAFLPENENEFSDVNDIEQEKAKIEDINQEEIQNVLEKYFEKKEKQLLNEILKVNNIDKLILVGEYSPDSQGRSFGFFENVTHLDGYTLIYPIIETTIDNLFINSTELENGKKYTFEVNIASQKVRRDKKNPFLIQAKTSNIKEIIKLTQLEEIIKNKTAELDLLIKNKQKELDDISFYLLQSVELKKNKLQEIENEIVIKKEKLLNEIEEDINTIDKQKEERLQEANNLIDEYNSTLISLQSNIEEKNKHIELLKQETRVAQDILLSLGIKHSEIETSIKFIRNKIEICKNLEFLSNEDAANYILHLDSNKIELGNEFLDFEKDLQKSFPKLVGHILYYLYHAKGLIYTKFQIENFLTLLLTNDIIVLSGLSGSGKTQIVKAFADAIGGVAKIIPVKPNWTSSDDLLGYYNPIQSSFLPTPFTEAIAEATQNPHRMFLICLDEMNLARAEYYFADFLSKLEERNKQPEIDLYAKHEEELFLSEFKTLLSLIESSINEKEINSWRDFLDNDEIRNRFFDLIGNKENDTMLQIHSKMKRRLIDILKFPSTITIPPNVRFIGAINVDETTHYFSPKILDRVHIVKFENPLQYNNLVSNNLNSVEQENELKPVYVHPSHFGQRTEFPLLNNDNFQDLVKLLKKLNFKYLLPLSIDFGVRSIRQALNYAEIFDKITTQTEFSVKRAISLNAIILQKILPRFLFENSELKSGKHKKDILNELKTFLSENLEKIRSLGIFETGFMSDEYLNEMLNSGEQINFWSGSVTFEDVEIHSIPKTVEDIFFKALEDEENNPVDKGYEDGKPFWEIDEDNPF